MNMFQAASEKMLLDHIHDAEKSVIFVAPGVTEKIADELVSAHKRLDNITVVLDTDEHICHIGYGDIKGFDRMKSCLGTMELRNHPGVRLGLVVTDKVVIIWSPIARSVEADRLQNQPNAIVFKKTADADTEWPIHGSNVQDSLSQRDEGSDGFSSLMHHVAKRLSDEKIGAKKIQTEELEKVVKKIEENPPAPFDLARKVRVFTTRFQFVETELKGAQWTERRIKVSSLLLNADLPEGLQNIVETRIRPYQESSDFQIETPLFVRGQIAYNVNGKKIRIPTSQKEVRKYWTEIRDRYLFKIPGFGSIIRRSDLKSFHEETEAYQCVLREWVSKFRIRMKENEERLVSEIVASIRHRIKQSNQPHSNLNEVIDLEREVRNGLKRIKVIEPRVRIVIKNVSWESTRNDEFTSALKRTLPADDLKDWYSEFTAVQEVC